jgi:heme-degrading monooxygenase HmoA
MSLNNFAQTPQPPYYAVIFASLRAIGDDGYSEMAEKTVNLAQNSPGFLGVDSARGSDGFGITISYWKTEEDALRWKENSEHKMAQFLGRKTWYKDFSLRVAEVKRSYTK